MPVVFWTAPARADYPDFSAYNALLERHVSPATIQGIRLNQVNYTAWRRDANYHIAIAELAAFDPGRLVTKEEKLAFWINAYNLLAIKVVIDHEVTGSIKDAGWIFNSVWLRNAGKVGGKTRTLDKIEHSILRPMGDPRIHMAIVCASLSCPDLRPEAYLPDHLDDQLEDQARSFLANDTKGLKGHGRKVTISKIFDWFGDDFGGETGVIRFLQEHVVRVGEKPELIDGYFDYNWSLNGTQNL
ncbi:MAG: DUF547 domain-containing protein [Leptospirillia bacterium]